MKQKILSTLISPLIFILFLLPERTSCADPHYEACFPKSCGNQRISFPFRIKDEQEQFCGYPRFDLTCQNNRSILLQTPGDNHLQVQQIFYSNHSLRVFSSVVLELQKGCFPQISSNLSLEKNTFEIASSHSELYLLSSCSKKLLGYEKINHCDAENRDSWGLVMFGEDKKLGYGLEICRKVVVVPVERNGNDGIRDYVNLLRRGILLKWTASNCSVCEQSGGNCGFDKSSFHFKCFCPDRPHAARCRPRKTNLRLIRGLVISGSALFIICIILILWRCKIWKRVSSYFLPRKCSSSPSSKSDLEGGTVYFGVPVFSYTELEEATNNFDPSKELGDGGFGTVYHGKLKDGREVAVKRLYEHNYKRVSQFLNEIEILTRLRHRNLVSLYGCTSRQSRGLILVYEYIPNGTVADHLHGDRAKDCPLTWPIRMNIAIETARALSYLHASDIIHRDVKTNNILLDNNFCVKVADFGLSRLFPTDVTHVSTAPQGTPGYVDPEYHQCYQLTDKSDVYSFGVVLIELISSMPAVDIGRHRHEINLANLAINRIQNRAFSGLIDPSLGFESDSTVERMITLVAEVAFRCLQLEKEMRPTMDEVLEALEEIQDYKDENNGEEIDNVGVLRSLKPPPSPEGDDVELLKHKTVPLSPDSVTNRWVSSSTSTTSISSV